MRHSSFVFSFGIVAQRMTFLKRFAVYHLLPNINTGNPYGICLRMRATSKIEWEITMYEVHE